MSGQATRRGFLRTALAGGGCLAMQGFSKAASPASARPAGDSPRGSIHCPLLVVTQTVSRDVQARAGAWCYITEILRRAGLFFEQASSAELPARLPRSKAVVLLAGNLPLAAAERTALVAWVHGGGALVGVGGVSGLDDVFGTTGESPFYDGWIKVTAADHAITAGLRSSLHVFGGYAMKVGTATALAEVDTLNRGARGSAILENQFGKGRAVLLAPDLLFSIVHIQQGLPVFQDAHPAPDKETLVNEGVLKAEDGLVLDWQRDRTPMPPDNVPVFLEPVTDELREIILRSVFHVARSQGVALAMLWQWPRDLKAVGHISHDTDGHDPVKAAAMFEVLNRCRIKSTWCTLFPGGYPAEFYRKLIDQDFEIAMHYDAMSGRAQTSWSKENFAFQHRWLRETTGLKHITSNKNHYTRWEGRLDFFRWCEELGVHSDQTRGPSKKGCIGFPLGGSQPYFPLDDEGPAPRLMNVLEVNMLTQDLAVVCPAEYGKQLLDSARRHYGVAHFLFHPAHILKPPPAAALAELVDYGRSQGLEWWTNAEIYRWEMLRRRVNASFPAANVLTLHAGQPLQQATLLRLRSGAERPPLSVNGRAAASVPWKLYGFDFDALTVDLQGETTVRFA